MDGEEITKEDRFKALGMYDHYFYGHLVSLQPYKFTKRNRTNSYNVKN